MSAAISRGATHLPAPASAGRTTSSGFRLLPESAARKARVQSIRNPAQLQPILELERRLDAHVEEAREFLLRRRSRALHDIRRDRFCGVRDLTLECAVPGRRKSGRVLPDLLRQGVGALKDFESSKI